MHRLTFSQISQGRQHVSFRRCIWYQPVWPQSLECPEAVVENRRHNSTVGVIPTRDCRTVSRVQRILKDGVMVVKLLPCLRVRVVYREMLPIVRDTDTVHAVACHQRRQDLFCSYPCWNYMGKDGRLRCQLVKGRKLKSLKSSFIQLVIRQLVKHNPDNSWSPSIR